MRSEHRHLILKEYQNVSLVERDKNLAYKTTKYLRTLRITTQTIFRMLVDKQQKHEHMSCKIS